MAKKKVKMLKSRFGPDGSFMAGEVYEVEAFRAEQWIAAGCAEEVKNGNKRKKKNQDETASVNPSEEKRG